jgi:hypothetical protein
VLGTLAILLVVGLVLAVGFGRFVSKARGNTSGSWEGQAALGSIVVLVGIAAATAAALAIFGMLLY